MHYVIPLSIFTSVLAKLDRPDPFIFQLSSNLMLAITNSQVDGIFLVYAREVLHAHDCLRLSRFLISSLTFT